MSNSSFAVRGVIEGFYGTFYTFPQRNDLIRFLGQHGFNTYVYGPKNDRHHRRDWRSPYPPQHMQQFAHTVSLAQEVGLQFAFALSPGQDIRYSAGEDFSPLTEKLSTFYEVGVRAFSLFLNDIDPHFHNRDDESHYANYAAAQADLCNRTLAWLQELDDSCTLSMCPTEYHGTPPFSDYLFELGKRLAPEIDVFYTGPKVCSPRITAADANAFAEAVRRPPLIWDNYPVNDLAMQPEMHIGPIRGRDSSLHEVVRGVLPNLMLQPEASKIPLFTFAAYFRDSTDYDPERAWEAALQHVSGSGEPNVPARDALLRFAENSLGGCLLMPEAETLTRLAQDALTAAQSDAASDDGRFQALEEYLLQLDAACYHINYYMPNLALRQDLLPWTETLKRKQELGRQALALLRTGTTPSPRQIERLEELINENRADSKRIGGDGLLPLASHALRVVRQKHNVTVAT